ncbi:AAEL003981-PA [Aedes aegypti]|uniref:AAEL003981-PA n=1 Tax=Aedes aegypti TaxID=7159 RepID=Q17E19_AEDAE|nr:AAEL003981-PA [Aedes aegypti]
MNFAATDAGFDESLAVKGFVGERIMELHIICVANRYKRGNLYVVIEHHVIFCGMISL